VHRVADFIIPRVIPQPTKWQRIGNEINAAMIFARTDFVLPDNWLLFLIVKTLVVKRAE
jgi:hypothetical protein